MKIAEKSEALVAMGVSGISTEAIEELLSEIGTAQDEVVLGDDSSWQQLEELKAFWLGRLAKLQAYLAC